MQASGISLYMFIGSCAGFQNKLKAYAINKRTYMRTYTHMCHIFIFEFCFYSRWIFQQLAVRSLAFSTNLGKECEKSQ